MIEMKRWTELKTFFQNHRDSSPDLIERAYRINRNASRNTLEEHKERLIIAAIQRHEGGNAHGF